MVNVVLKPEIGVIDFFKQLERVFSTGQIESRKLVWFVVADLFQKGRRKDQFWQETKDYRLVPHFVYTNMNL